LLERFSIVCKRFVNWLVFICFCLNHEPFLGQTTAVPNYICGDDSGDVQFTLSVTAQSAWQPLTNCSVPQCNISASNDNSCRSSSTPCFNYLTFNGVNLCAPAVLCSILEPCDNNTYTCASNTSVCVVNSCCSPQAVCLPLTSATFCSSGGEFL
jgi:hypothetical protein